MKSAEGKLKLGIVGCGTIGSRIARSIIKELKGCFTLEAVYDIDQEKTRALVRRLKLPKGAVRSLEDLIRSSDVIVEAVNTPATSEIVCRALDAGKNVLAMSVGRLLTTGRGGSLFSLTRHSKGKLLLPSGAVAGLDAIKAAALAGIKTITLTSTKPPTGFANNLYVRKKKINLDDFTGEVVLFDGKVKDAVRYFPQNINVAAAIALAAGPKAVLRVKIVASSSVSRNTHEICLEGAFGRIITRTENTICPDNPKTSYLAVLSGIRTLQEFSSRIKVGT